MTNREDENVMEVEEELKKAVQEEQEPLLTRFRKLQIVSNLESSDQEIAMPRRENPKLESYKREKESVRKALEIWNRSQAPEIKKSDLRKGKEKVVWHLEEAPLLAGSEVLALIGEITSGLSWYGEQIVRMARNSAKKEENWNVHFEAGVKVFKKLNGMMKKVRIEMERRKKMTMERDEEIFYARIEEMMWRLEEIYGDYLMDDCGEIGTVLERNCTEMELQRCEIQVNQCRVHLDVVTWGIGILHCYALFHLG